MTNGPILTPKRRDILEGKTADEMDITDATYREHRRKIEDKSKAALTELAEVARSPGVDTTEVFEPDDVFRLLQAIMLPGPNHTEGAGVYLSVGHKEAQENADNTGLVEVSDEFLSYQDRLHTQLTKLTRVHERATSPTEQDHED